MPKTYTNLLTHIIFATKERLPLIDDEIKFRLHAYLGGIVREIGGTAIIVGGVKDHVHLLVSLPPTLALSDVLRIIKTNSSRWMHEQNRKDFQWQTGFGAFSVSFGNVEKVKNYIAKQELHHQKTSFRAEFIDFLERSKMDFDEKFLWT
jgi:putative transposase